MTDRLHDRIRTELEHDLVHLGSEPGPLAAVRAAGGRLRRRRRIVLGAVAALVVAGAGVTVEVGQHDAPRPQPATGVTWTEVAPAPLAPRHSAIATWTGHEMVVVGGGIDPPCPPNASCVTADTYTRDGAAYDPSTDRWRRIADAPVEVGPGFTLTRATDDLLVLSTGYFGRDSHWWSYDLADDRWAVLPDAPGHVIALPSAVDGLLYALTRSGTVLTLDPSSSRWSELPRNPMRPALAPLSVLATPAGVFVSGTDPRTPDDGDTPSYVQVERWDGARWQRYPVTGQVGTDWSWTGSRLVALSPLVATGLTGRPPEGGVLDIATGAWSPLPNAPDPEHRDVGDSWSVNAAAGPLIASWDSVYDDRTQTWTPQGRPPGTGVETDQVAVWADDRLIVFGGLDPSLGYRSRDGLSAQTWIRVAG